MEQAPLFDYKLRDDLFRYNASLGLYRFFKGIDYIRVMELPIFASAMLSYRSQKLRYLDIGTGESIFPSFIADQTNFLVTVIDKFTWVRKQKDYLKRIGKHAWLKDGRFSIIEHDFLSADLPESSFDIITAISVLEHIDGNGDTKAMEKIFRLLKPGGLFLMSSPYNHDKPDDYYVKSSVYGDKSQNGQTFFQRHYGAETLVRRIINVTPFVVENLFFAGHYQRFNFAKYLYVLPMPIKLIKVFYNWAASFYTPHFMQFSNQPPSDANPDMVTMDTVFLFFRKPK